MKVVIVGAGVVGVSTAYYLHKLNEDLEIVIIDQVGLAAGASGSSSALLRVCEGKLSELAARSFDLHKQLAEEFGAENIDFIKGKSAKIGVPRDWAHMDLTMSSTSTIGSEILGDELFDVDRLTELELNSTEDNCAQVNPSKLIKLLFEASGAELILGEIVGTDKNVERNELRSILIRSSTTKEMLRIEADKFCFCMGAWTEKLRKMGISVPESMGRRSTSVLLEPVFGLRNTIENSSGLTIRTDRERLQLSILKSGEISVHLEEKQVEKVKEKANAFTPDHENIKKLLKFVDFLCPKERVFEKVLDARTSHIPFMEHYSGRSQVPVISVLPDYANGFVSAGHGGVGILLGPISGQILAEMIVNGESDRVLDTEMFKVYKEENLCVKNRRSACRATRINGVLRRPNIVYRGETSAP